MCETMFLLEKKMCALTKIKRELSVSVKEHK